MIVRFVALLLLMGFRTVVHGQSVNIFHFIDNVNWGEVDGSAVQGQFTCFPRDKQHCNIYSSDCKGDLTACLQRKMKSTGYLSNKEDISLALYHIHSWGLLSQWPHGPDQCRFPAHYTMAESEESHGRFHKLFKASFEKYDGNSTTNPFASVPRSYFSGLNTSEFVPMKQFASLIRGASFVASTCHRGEGTTKRGSVLAQLQAHFRVDSLGKCHTTRLIPEGIVLKSSHDALENLRYKQQAISNYLFYCAFENTHERGYVTEKVFDALIAGVVPIYLGPSEDCRPLLPHPKAAIFLDDFNHDIRRVAEYLSYLTANETAYEEHRAWRHKFDPALASSMFTKSWPCRLCEWALSTANADPQLAARRERVNRIVNNNMIC